MAAAEQIKNLIASFGEGDEGRFFATAIQIAASEARQGHAGFAQELKKLIEKAKKDRSLSFLSQSKVIPISSSKCELHELIDVFQPNIRLGDMVLASSVKNELDRLVKEQKTSGAAALASKMAAELRTAYPDFWPETIRALMVHSAEWTDKMLNGQQFSALLERERFNLLRSVGYGVPILESALYSAQNSLTLVAEREIQPYRMQGSETRYNEYHLFAMPWPIDVLQDFLFDQDVTLKVTLSYFIEPNPGSRNKKYANNFQYHSHSLDFAVIKPTESLDSFRRRVSAASNSTEDDLDTTDEPWLIKKRVRSRGSIKKDFITMSGAEMATRNILAVYPKSGWYRLRKKLGKVEAKVRYSIIISLETSNVEADIYTPVFNQISSI